MNTKIANILKTKIEALSFADKVGGLVHIGEYKDNGVLKKFPISTDVTHSECINGRYSDLVPNDKYKSVMFFEDNGVRSLGTVGKLEKYESSLNLVGWLNLKKIGRSDEVDITSKIVCALTTVLTDRNIEDDCFQRLSIKIDGQLPKDKRIFGKYTFADETQYLMFPFTYFALRISAEFCINPTCPHHFILGVEDECLEC